MRSVRPCRNTRNFCEFCNTSVPVPGTSVSSVRSHTLTRIFFHFCEIGTIPGVWVYVCCNTPGTLYLLRFIPKRALCIMMSCLVSHTNRTPNRSTYNTIVTPVHVFFVSKDTYQQRTRLNRKCYFVMNRVEFDSIWWKHSNLPLIGKPCIAYCKCCFAPQSKHRRSRGAAG